MPFLEVITRCYKRPVMLAANQASMLRQTDGDWVQTLLVDDVGRGVAWSHENMGAYAPKLVGNYIWILDDDDECVHPELVAELKFIVADSNPDVIMVKMDHGNGVILPSDRWRMAPEYGRIGVSAYIVRRQVWQWHAHALTPGWYGSDFSLINAIWRSQPTVYWHDCIASRVQRHSEGKPEGI